MFDNRDLKLDLMALGLLALVVFLTLSLATYNQADPPGSLVWPPAEQVHNACGHSGALVSHALLELFGIGAYYLVFSLGVLDYLLLTRRGIDQPWLRGTGWVLSLAGLSTLVALIAPEFSSGPVIGPGGYLGAAGRSLLEMNFASAGSYILTLSVLVAGLLLCTDYLLFRYAAQTVEVSTKGLAHVGNKLASRKLDASGKKSDVDEWEAPEPKKTKGSKGSKSKEKEAKESEEADEPVAEPAVRIRRKHKNSEEAEEDDTPSASTDAAEDETDEPADGEEQPGIRKRVASALRIRKPASKSEREEVMEELDEAARQDEARDYELPPIDLLLEAETVLLDEHEKEVRQKAKLLEKTFASFGFKVKVVEIETGPVIAQYEVELESGLRLSKITSLSDDLAIALRVPSVRIVAPIPGKNTVGIEIPNVNRQLVRLREVMEEVNGKAKRLKIPLYLGKDVSGKAMVVDLAALPHLLIAGRTGTGKSVCLNSIIVSMLMTRRPDEVRMLMIDPKMVELSPYKTLPHLMHPVVTDMRKAEAILAWAVDKMEERYALLARAGVRHVTVYNQLGEEELMERLAPEDEEERKNIPRYLPFIVVVADEIADLMMTSGKEVEQHIIRLAQKSRAVGIHLILATQKPTVDVITGLIKSNLPARIAFQVSSRTDSRVVLDEMGADKLLGNGDMLFLLPGTSTLLRGQGTYLSDDEINRVVDFVGTTEPQFVKELVQLKAKDESEGVAGGGKLIHRDELYEAAVDIIVREGRGSVSLLQRALGIGYGRGARLIDFMAEDGIVGPYNGSQAREVLLTIEQWETMCGEGNTKGGSTAPAATISPIAPKPVKRSNKIRMEPEEEEELADEGHGDEEQDAYEEDTEDDAEEDTEEVDTGRYEQDYRAERA